MPHHDGTAYKISGPRPPGECYPATGTYTFGEFAGPVFEHGGYGGDMSLVDPWSGRRLWVADVMPDGEDISTYDALRKVIAVAEEARFFDIPDVPASPAGQTPTPMPGAKLTRFQVAGFRIRAGLGDTTTAMAAEAGIGELAMYEAVTGVTWQEKDVMVGVEPAGPASVKRQ